MCPPLPPRSCTRGTPGLQGEGNAHSPMWIQQLPAPLLSWRLNLHTTELSQAHASPEQVEPCSNTWVPCKPPLHFPGRAVTPLPPQNQNCLQQRAQLICSALFPLFCIFSLKKYSALVLITCIIYNNYMPILISGPYYLDIATKSKAVLCIE